MYAANLSIFMQNSFLFILQYFILRYRLIIQLEIINGMWESAHWNFKISKYIFENHIFEMAVKIYLKIISLKWQLIFPETRELNLAFSDPSSKGFKYIYIFISAIFFYIFRLRNGSIG